MHYYPFGMLMEGIGTAAVTQNKYKYNGKEMNEDFGLNLSDYGARWYDAALGRWWSVDPKSGKYANLSPYNYVANSPLLLIDPFGMQSKFYDNGNAHLEGVDAQNYFRGIQQREKKRAKMHEKSQGAESDGMAIFIGFPDANPPIPSNQKIVKWGEKKFGGGDGNMKVGHAGVVIIDTQGHTNYFDFGRYSRRDIKKERGKDEGVVRSSKHYDGLKVPDWNFAKSETETVTAIMAKLHNSTELSGYGRMVGALAKGLDYTAMKDYARGAEYEGYLPFGGYASGYDYCNSATYCAKFARGVGAAGGVNWDWDTFTGEGNVDDIVKDYKTTKIKTD
jgi:RHS repeat-associated protein